MRIIIGIDLAVKGEHCAAIINQAGKTLRRRFLFRTRVADLERLLKIARREANVEEVVAVMEPTGSAWLPVASYLKQQDVIVYLVRTAQMANLRQYYSKYVKGDRKDAAILAHMPLIDPEGMRPLLLPDADHLAGQRLSKQHQRLKTISSGIKNRIGAWEHDLWPGLGRVIKKRYDPWVIQWRKTRWYLPEVLAAADESQISSALVELGAPSDEVPHMARALRQVAEEALLLFGPQGCMDYVLLQDQVVRELDLLAHCQAELKVVEKKIRALHRKLEPERHLESIRGVGPMGAAVYTFFIGDVGRFATQAQFRSWSGMIPKSSQSGNAEKKGLRITLAGPDPIKHYAYINAEIARQWDPQIACIYYDQMMNKGKHHTQAVCHCATHLLDRIRAVLRDGCPYELRDVDGRPVSRKEARQIILERYQVPEEVRKRRSQRKRQDSNTKQRRRSRPVRKKLAPQHHFTQDELLHDERIILPT